MATDTLYYVLREGSTREEQWSWEDIESLRRSGELSGNARVFLPDEDRWALLSETRIGGTDDADPDGGANEAAAARAALEEAYQAAIDRIDLDNALEALLDAGVLAVQLDKQVEARAHFQDVLNRYPYHPRAAQEIKRRYSVAEQRKFRSLDRPAPVWDDLGSAAAMPLARGPIHFFAPAAVLVALSFLPYGHLATVLIAFLWIFQIMEYTARGASRTPDWNRAWADPIRKLVRPALLMGVVVAQWAAVLIGLARLAMLAGGVKNETVWSYMAASPLFVVLVWIVAALYLPAATVSTGGFVGSVAKTLDPRRLVRMVGRMEHEYVYSVALLGVLVGVVALVRVLTGSIALVGNVAQGLVLAYALPLAGLILGRLLGRTGHVIS
ncbi:MAG: hypothetical protein OEX18_11785 [Candidatus Krumholzibacteria bacterium]|nr:hypothetical protein [Candidatus Krumholzibacteria bacterium]MDH4337942.1 hypothetical protein [Candidatus Krumholzibacteria bacterium]MDH5270312.1 hypothetical protein [Candidatus Krumholzibacteria bacterium]